MIRVLYSPQRSDNIIEYAFGPDAVTATYQEVPSEGELPPAQSDTFDFNGLPDGESGEITTTLSINPLIAARRVDGVLELELLHFHGEEATEEERYPDWVVING